ncbi:putative membrane protein [Streptomyces sp. CG 926]|nr:putative membrane protein [Streptomyces sp. CG 926]
MAAERGRFDRGRGEQARERRREQIRERREQARTQAREHGLAADAAERSGERSAKSSSTGSSALTRSRVRLDQPRAPRRSLLPEYDPEAFGRLSERVARFLGTGRFIVWMTLVIIVWVLWNIFAPDELRFDPYPFIFLTLMLSLQASYAAPLILLAQNRQDDRDRVTHEQDRKQNERSIADTEYLTREIAALRMGLGEVATRDWIRSEFQDLIKEMDERRLFPAERDEGDR